jgi:hypothetical protein
MERTAPWPAIMVLATATLLALLALLAPGGALAEAGGDGVPEVSPQPAQVDAGQEFDLEVSVLAHANGTYRVTFDPRAGLTFPGPLFQEIAMASDDAAIFKVRCAVDGGMASDDYLMMFNLTWTADGTTRSVPGTVKVTVGGGPGSDVCSTSVMVAAASVATLVLEAGRRRW